jgi:hypothetical protein
MIDSKNIRGRAPLAFRNNVNAKLDEWFGEEKYEVLFAWFDEGNAYICAQTKLPTGSDWDTKEITNWVKTIYFLTLFEIGGKMELSQDRKIVERD